MDIEKVLEAKRRHLGLLLAKRNVVACGVGYKEIRGKRTEEPCVVVSVTKKMPEAQLAPDDIVPKRLEGVKTDVVETGVIRALKGVPGKSGLLRDPNDRTAKWRPAPGGVSCGHIDITAGTLGCLVTRSDQLFILSNNHVLGNSNAGQKGDPILQPGPYDGGTADDCIAVLEEFVPIEFETGGPTCPIAKWTESFLNWLARILGSSHRVKAFKKVLEVNQVDAAIAKPLSEDLVKREILEIGVPKGSREATLGTKVKKSGRTSGLTTGEIIQVHVTVRVNYGDNKVALFTDQLMAGAMSSPGDSGSAVLDEEDYVVGLLFAGSDRVTLMNPIHYVLEALNVAIAGVQ